MKVLWIDVIKYGLITVFLIGCYLFVKDISSAISFFNLLIILLALLLKWPKAEWLGIERVQEILEQRKSKLVTLSHICQGKKGQLEYCKFTAEEIARDGNLKPYQIASFWVDETTGIVKDIKVNLIKNLLFSSGVFLVTLFLTSQSISLKESLKDKKATQNRDEPKLNSQNNVKNDSIMETIHSGDLLKVDNKPNTKSLKSDEKSLTFNEEQINDFFKMAIGLITPLVNMTYFFTLCFFAYQKNSKI